jgi:hypothetical protein
MANMVIPNEGKLLWAAWAFRDTSGFDDWRLALFQNNLTPVDGSVKADFTESTFTGYSPVSIARGAMGAPAIVANVAVCTLSTVPTFTCTAGSGQLAYGWFLWAFTANKVLAAQRFDAARNMSANTIERIDPFALRLKTFA